MDKLLTTKEVADYLSVCKTTIYNLMKFKNFPKPKRYSKHNRWLLSDVDNWLKSQ